MSLIDADTGGAMNTVWRATDAGVAIVANAEDDA